MNRKLISFLFVIFSLFSCDIDSDWSDPNNPYEDYSGRMIERIRIGQNNLESDYIYYNYDRRGRIISVDDTYYGTIDSYVYDENDYGDDIITVRNNIGEDRDIILDWDGYAEQEQAYRSGVLIQSIGYDYIGDRLWNIDIEEYYNDGSIFSEERYDFDFDYNDNLCSIDRYYEEDDYYVDSELTFSSFDEYENNYNIDILSIIGLYVDDDFASQIGRTGERSKHLPTRATLKINRNGRYDDDIYYRISYIGSGGLISAIEITTSLGASKVYYISYL